MSCTTSDAGLGEQRLAEDCGKAKTQSVFPLMGCARRGGKLSVHREIDQE
jgi:hypothetical protein